MLKPFQSYFNADGQNLCLHKRGEPSDGFFCISELNVFSLELLSPSLLPGSIPSLEEASPVRRKRRLGHLKTRDNKVAIYLFLPSNGEGEYSLDATSL